MGWLFLPGLGVVNKFELSSVFLIGHEKIDSGHAELVSILNKMVDGFNQGMLNHAGGNGCCFMKNYSSILSMKRKSCTTSTSTMPSTITKNF
ncbi:MAG: hypothetical protein GXP02_09320 [Alphaproteobacteria bacterium]|nr:hypothetical protein [Alphaproteobacteria bacterium]